MLVLVVFLQVPPDVAQDAREGIALQQQQLGALRRHAHGERSLHAVDQSDLAKVVAVAQHSDGLSDLAFFVLVAEFDLAFLNDVEVISPVTLVEDELALLSRQGLKPVNQLDLLVLL